MKIYDYCNESRAGPVKSFSDFRYIPLNYTAYIIRKGKNLISIGKIHGGKVADTRCQRRDQRDGTDEEREKKIHEPVSMFAVTANTGINLNSDVRNQEIDEMYFETAVREPEKGIEKFPLQGADVQRQVGSK